MFITLLKKYEFDKNFDPVNKPKSIKNNTSRSTLTEDQEGDNASQIS